MTIRSSIKLVLQAIFKVFGAFIISRLAIDSFGIQSFVRYSQIQQLVIFMPAVATCFFQLIVAKSHNGELRKSESYYVRRVLLYSLMLSAFFLITCALDRSAVSSYLGFVIGKAQSNDDILLIIPSLIVACGIYGVFSSMLLGRGDSRSLVNLDLTVQLFILLISITFIYIDSSKLFQIAIPAVYILIVPFLFFGIFILRPSNASSSDSKIRPYNFVLCSLIAALAGPISVVLLRSALINHSGDDNAAQFIATQRVAGAVMMPIILYIIYRIQPRFFKVKEISIINYLQSELIKLLCLGAFLIGSAMPLLEVASELAFGGQIKITYSVFIILTIAEMLRSCGTVFSYAFSANGKSSLFLTGELVFFISIVSVNLFNQVSLIQACMIYLGASFLFFSYGYAFLVRKKWNVLLA